jgi:hypothetical protein
MTFNEGIIWSMKLINWKKKEEKFLREKNCLDNGSHLGVHVKWAIKWNGTKWSNN